MNYAALLGIKEGTFSQWAEAWIAEIVPLAQSVYTETTDTPLLRERNEKLSSYLATISIVRAAYRNQIQLERGKYAKDHPKPEKGVKDWEEAFKIHLGETQIVYDLLGDLHEDLGRRISVTQTHLRSLSSEASTVNG